MLTVVMPIVGEQITTVALIGGVVEFIGWMVALMDPTGRSIPSQNATGAWKAFGKLEHVTGPVL